MLDETIHQHLIVESPDPEVQAELESAQKDVNEDWANQNLPKFIQFGKDNQGAHSHALNGPAFEAVMSHPQLLVRTYKRMEKVYAMLEARQLTPGVDERVEKELAQGGEAAAGKSAGKPAKKAKKKAASSSSSEDAACEAYVRLLLVNRDTSNGG